MFWFDTQKILTFPVLFALITSLRQGREEGYFGPEFPEVHGQEDVEQAQQVAVLVSSEHSTSASSWSTALGSASLNDAQPVLGTSRIKL